MALDHLIDNLKQGDDPNREAAAQALAAWGNRALEPLRQLLAGSPDQRWWATRTLAAVATSPAIEALKYLLSDADPDVRACAAHGLGEILARNPSDRARPETIARLIDSLEDDSAYVARIAGNALIRIGQPAAPALTRALSHPSPSIRAGAARALVPLKFEEAIPTLYAALDDDSALVSHYATEALEKLGLGIVLLA